MQMFTGIATAALLLATASTGHAQVATKTVLTLDGAKQAIVAAVDRSSDPGILFVKQYRHPVGELTWEIPAGIQNRTGRRCCRSIPFRSFEEN